ncbi:MAG: HXXEE domain-containing protein [Byssovorax sp.]
MGAILFDWPYTALAVTPLMLAAFALEKRAPDAAPRWRDPASILPLLWPMYLLHQFEEHGVDLLGRRYAFLGELCRVLGPIGASGDCPADPAFIFAVNCVGAQIAFLLSVVFRKKRPVIAACAWGIALVNAVTHIGSAIAHLAYNPGLLTSVVLFVPMSAWMLHTVLKAGVVERRRVPRIFATGVALHAVLLGSLLLHARGWLSETGLLLVNGANGLWPLVFGTLGLKPPVPAE